MKISYKTKTAKTQNKLNETLSKIDKIKFKVASNKKNMQLANDCWATICFNCRQKILKQPMEFNSLLCEECKSKVDVLVKQYDD